MSESNIMHEATARIYHQWNAGLPINAGQLIRAWFEAPEPESDIPPAWWTARLRETCPGTKAVNLVHLYRAATAHEVDNGFMSMEWTTDREAALSTAHKGLRIPVEAVVSPAAILAVIGTENGGTVLVDPWEIRTIYLSEDVREDRLSTVPPTPTKSLLRTTVEGLGAPMTLATVPKPKSIAKGIMSRLSAGAQSKP
ncbi:hypothetical protein BJF89_08725 [Corynebacterium sp. CNJ-954]|uniref:hypothetical protein n=1 Tax=Corynebacterium sp. CNJ-954 TaxID=1904962 RepID=UPI000963175D|nr:hypothetical protein [Corynebacterium sp. CNJ-954]OLT51184.1 hypothetical protein BJF89_08725 [Corynebacterium sp. CNJ-954]